MWIRLVLLGIGLLVTALLLARWWGTQRWQQASAQLLAQLQATATSPTGSYSATELAALPPPVARYFRLVLPDRQPLIRQARIHWRGEFNLGQPGNDQWRPFTATQVFVPAAPGFVWDARIRQAPGLQVFVRDCFWQGKGSMYGTVWGVWPVVDAHDKPTLDEGALQRYLGETVWLPTALLPSQGVQWTALDDTRAQATLNSGTHRITLEFRFGADGLISSIFTPTRYYDDGRTPPQLLPWQARILRYEKHHGLLVPAEAVVEWLFPHLPFAYWRGQPLKIQYETA